MDYFIILCVFFFTMVFSLGITLEYAEFNNNMGIWWLLVLAYSLLMLGFFLGLLLGTLVPFMEVKSNG